MAPPVLSIQIKRKYAYVRASFEASKNATLRDLPDALWVPSVKAWRVPLESLSHLITREGLRLDWDISDTESHELLVRLREQRDKALTAWQTDPLSVPDEYRCFLPVDVWFYWSDIGDALFAKLRKNDELAGIITQISQMGWSREERAYFIPVADFPALLRNVRKNGFTIGVSKQCAERLTSSAPLRRINDRALDRNELLRSCLRPALVSVNEDSERKWSLVGAPRAFCQDLFPELERLSDRKTLLHQLTFEDAISILHHFKEQQTELYLAQEFLEELKSFLETPSPYSLLCCIGNWGKLILAGFSKDLLEQLAVATQGKLLHYHLPEDVLSLLEVGEELGEVLCSDKGLSEDLDRNTCFLGDAQERYRQMKFRAERRGVPERIKALGEDLDPPLEFDRDFLQKLFPHQIEAVTWFVNQGSGLLGDDMGLGKTVSVIAAFHELRWRGEIENLLVVAPNSLVKNWLTECSKWLPKIHASSPPKGASFRRSYFAKLLGYEYSPIVVVNFESFRNPQVLQPLEQWARKHSTLLCVDESQRVKNPESKNFEALKSIAPVCRRRILLSGTPTPRDIGDIWTQSWLIDFGERFGQNYLNWLKNIATIGTKYSRVGVVEYKPKEVHRVTLRVRDFLLRRRKDEVVDLPEKLFSIREVELKGQQLARYQEVCDELKLRMSSITGKVFYRALNNVLEEFLRAVQIASNPRLVDDTFRGEPAKFLELDELLDQLVEEQGEKVVVWTNYLKNVRELIVRYAKYGAKPFSGEQSVGERDQTVRDFQEPNSNVRVLVAVPAAGGVGITLTAARTVIYLDKTWNAEHWLQSIDRVHRIGQTGTVNVISLESGRVDGLIANNLEKKRRLLEELFDSKVTPAGEEEVSPSFEELLEALG